MLYQTKNPHGGDIYGGGVTLDFSANVNPFGTPRGVVAAVKNALSELHRYPDPYCRALVGAIAEHERLPESAVLCGNGAAELIYAYCDAVRPRRAVELAPTFSEYSLALERTGCKMERYPLRRETDFTLDSGFLDFLAEKAPEAVFLCNPNNPTGRVIPMPLLEEILRFCRESNIRLFVDECFLDLSDSGGSLKEWLAENPQLFLLKAFTKSYGMAGVRLGYCLSMDGALLARMARAVQPWNVSTPAQAAGVAALREQDFLRQTRAAIFEQRVWLKTQLEALGLWVCPSDANYLLFCGPVGLDAALRKRGIAIRSCDNYDGLGPGWYRIAVRRAEENKVLIGALEEALPWQKIS